MRQYCFYFFTWILSSCTCTVFSQDKIAQPIVVIDPGHGGMDRGAIGINGIREKDVVLKIGMEILRLNSELYGNVLEIYSTRYTDTLISLNHRTKLANAIKADVFISIHFNQAVRKAAKGIEVYLSKSNRKSENFAKLLAYESKGKLGLKNRGVKYGNFQVLREIGNAISVLLELGFLSNNEEAKHIRKWSSISAYALLIIETILKHYNYD